MNAHYFFSVTKNTKKRTLATALKCFRKRASRAVEALYNDNCDIVLIANSIGADFGDGLENNLFKEQGAEKSAITKSLYFSFFLCYNDVAK